MTTANDIVTGALLFMKQVNVGDTIDADTAQAVLNQLNDYLNGLNSRGAVFPTVDLALTDPVPISAEQVGDLKRALALKAESDFGSLLQPQDRAEAKRADQRFLAAYITINPTMPDGLGQMPSQRRPYWQGRLV